MQAVLSRLRARSDSEEGFTIVEMMVALMVISIVMTSLAYVMAVSLKQVSFAKQREVANSLVDKTMEQARALPYSMIQTGLDDHDVTTSGDSNITISGSTYTYVPTGETVVHGSQNGNQTCPSATVCQAPIVPHQSTTTLNGSSYKISTYLTNFSGSAGAYRVTVAVSWTTSQVTGVSNQVSSQSVMYSPSNGCLSDQTHPFSSPCNPFLYAQASTGKGAITITPPIGSTGNAIQGVNLDQAQLQTGTSDSAMQIEQIYRVEGGVTTGGANLSAGGVAQQPVGAQSSSSQVDNDPATQTTSQPSCPISQGSTTPLADFDPGGSGNGITLNANSTDSGCTVSTTNASSSSSPLCSDTLGSAVTTGLPCGSGSIQDGGTTQSAALTIALAGVSLGTSSLATITAAPSASKVFTSRLAQQSGLSCVGTSGDGCVHTEAQRSLGTVTLASLPTGVISSLPGWGSGTNNFLVQLSNYTDSVSAESGIGAAAPCAKQAATCNGTPGGTLKYWNGAGYTTTPVNWGATAPNITIPSVNVTAIVNGAIVNVSMTNSLTYGTTSTSTSGASPCRTTECKETAQSSSPIQGDIIYTVTVAGSTVANMDINVNLGTLAVQTNYKAAPLAG
ncbi:MAG: type II secretion system protein [Actinobacteria bacterium]|nr:MAG: type II secretion system protein [Actinomycetota bacterium]